MIKGRPGYQTNYSQNMAQVQLSLPRISNTIIGANRTCGFCVAI